MLVFGLALSCWAVAGACQPYDREFPGRVRNRAAIFFGILGFLIFYGGLYTLLIR